jgi:hypothetical protein
MRPLLTAALLASSLLAACSDPEPENIQARAANASSDLEQRYNQIQAEAENDVDVQAAPVDNEAETLLNQLNAVVADPDPAIANQGQPAAAGKK